MKALLEITPLRDGGFTCEEFLANLCNLRFESDVICSGNQTDAGKLMRKPWFESDVICSGNQTYMMLRISKTEFESDVICSGNQNMVTTIMSVPCFCIKCFQHIGDMT